MVRRLMGRALARAERAGETPWAIFRRQLGAGLVAGEGVQIGYGAGREHEYAHGTAFYQAVHPSII